MSDKYLRDERQQLLNALGAEACWGWSPAVDFAELLARCRARARTTRTRSRTTTTTPDKQKSNDDSNNDDDDKDDETSAAPRRDGSDDAFDALLRRVQQRLRTTTTPASGDTTHDDNATSTTAAAVAEGEGDAVTNGDDTHAERVVNVLLAGACDIRHILQTMATLRVREADTTTTTNTDATAAPVRYDFYLYEPNLRLHCRHVFFLQWLCDAMFALEELEERVHMYLDVYGNVCTRERTAAQSRLVVQHALQTLRELHAREYDAHTLPSSSSADDAASHMHHVARNNNNNNNNDNNDTAESVRLSSLLSWREMKLRERDAVEAQLQHWQRDASHADVAAQWSRRVRQQMAERYDNRDNLIDWDFVFRLSDYTPLLRFAEYRAWRNTGVAYDVAHSNPRRGFTYTYATPNKTLCVFDRHGHGSYAGDITVGPFYAFGVRSANAHLQRRNADGTCKYGNSIVAMQNVRALLYALLTGQRWPWSDHAFAWDDDAANYNYLPPSCRRRVCRDTNERTTTSNSNGDSHDDDNDDKQRVQHNADGDDDTDARRHTLRARLPRVRVHLLGLDWSRVLRRVRAGALPRFDAAFVGVSCAHCLTRDFFATAMATKAADNNNNNNNGSGSSGVVVAETVKFVVDAEEEAKAAFVDKLDALAAAARWCRDDACTAWLHTQQPLPRHAAADTTTAASSCSRSGGGADDATDANESPAMATARRRYAMPYQLVFVPRDDDDGDKDATTRAEQMMAATSV